MDLFRRVDFEPARGDLRRSDGRSAVLDMAEPRERVLYEKAGETVEGEEAVGAVAEIRHGESGRFRDGHGLGEDAQVRTVRDGEEVGGAGGRFKSRKGGYVPFGLYGRWKNARHAGMVRGKRGKSRARAARYRNFER